MENTYDWITETAHSRINSSNWVTKRTLTIIVDNEVPVFPRRVNKRWPAIMLAVNRIASVPGRIIFLIVSMHTIKGIRTGGVPWGTRWANMCIVLLIHPKIINLTHNGSASVSVKAKCLVHEKMYGNKLRKLLNKIIEKREMKIKVLPFILLIFKRILNSLWSVVVILIHIKLIRDGINQNILGRNISPNKTLIQFNERFVLVEGSKVENRFVIIFN